MFKYRAIPDKIAALKVEVKKLQEPSREGFELRLAKNNLEVL